MSKLLVFLNHNVLFISLLFRILQSLNHIQFCSCSESVHVENGKCYIIKTVSSLVLSVQACNTVKSQCFIHIIIINCCFYPKSHLVTSVHDK